RPPRPGFARQAPLTAALAIVAAACAHLPPRVVLPSAPLTPAALGAELEAYTSSPVVAGNRVDLLLNGEQLSRPCWRRFAPPATRSRSPSTRTAKGPSPTSWPRLSPSAAAPASASTSCSTASGASRFRQNSSRSCGARAAGS